MKLNEILLNSATNFTNAHYADDIFGNTSEANLCPLYVIFNLCLVCRFFCSGVPLEPNTVVYVGVLELSGPQVQIATLLVNSYFQVYYFNVPSYLRKKDF